MRRLLVTSTVLTLMLTTGGTAGAQQEPVAAGTFELAGSLAEPRRDHSATLLPDGRILVAGGSGEGNAPLTSAELWDPAGSSFGPADPLAETSTDPGAVSGITRPGHTETRLPDGRVLVIAGSGGVGGDILASAEVWDPATGSFEPAGTLAAGRWFHTATLLSDGRVLVVGGAGPDALDAAEVWDPEAAVFGPAGSLVSARSGHTATLLPDGRVLVVGGVGSGGPQAATEVWDPATSSFGPAGSLAEARHAHSATFLNDGRVLVVGGDGRDGRIASGEVWRSTTAPVKCFGKRPTLFALPGVEMVGTAGPDVIAGSVGADIIRGEGGNDRICAGGGADVVEGGGGKDRIDGGGGTDQLDGGASSDTISGGKGGDEILGGEGNDTLSGGGSDDTLDGGKGKDRCSGGPGHDRLPGCNERFRTRGTLFITRDTTLKGPHEGNIQILADNVRLDCGGHTITGLGKQNRRRVGGIGIHIDVRRRVTVTDCHVTNSVQGMQTNASSLIVIRDSSADRNGEGFVIPEATRVTLTDNTANDNDSWGFILAQGTKKSRLTRNVAEDNALIGFALGGSDNNTLRSNRARGNPTNYNIVQSKGNTFKDNAAEGPGKGFSIMGSDRNAFTGNATIGGGSDGGGGFWLNDSSRNTFTANSATDGPAIGFYSFLGSVNNTFTGNSSDGNVEGIADTTRGSGSAGTGNTYLDNSCAGNDLASDPPSLC